MSNKTTGLLLVGGAAVAAYFLFRQATPAQGFIPYGSTAIPPGGAFGGVSNQSDAEIWITATGQILNALGQATTTILPAVQK
jgi:hypothetical protein